MKFLRYFLLTIAMQFTVSAFCQTQANYNDFAKSFRQNINYPVALARDCTSSFCLLRIQFDPVQGVKDMSLSDGADTLLKAEFKTHMQKLNITALERSIKSEFANHISQTYLIPVSFSFRQMPCAPPSIRLESLYQYFKFNGKELTGPVILLPAIGTLQHIQR